MPHEAAEVGLIKRDATTLILAADRHDFTGMAHLAATMSRERAASVAVFCARFAVSNHSLHDPDSRAVRSESLLGAILDFEMSMFGDAAGSG